MILAIDPGPKESAWLWWDGTRILGLGIDENRDVRNMLVRQRDVCLMAVEWIEAMGMAVGKEVFETCLWVGKFVEAWDRPWKLVGRKSGVKMHICQSARATDANIRQALIDRFGELGKKSSPGVLFGVKSHLWSALAVAVTAFDQQAKEVPV